jgi:hypothetical protein
MAHTSNCVAGARASLGRRVIGDVGSWPLLPCLRAAVNVRQACKLSRNKRPSMRSLWSREGHIFAQCRGLDHPTIAQRLG